MLYHIKHNQRKSDIPKGYGREIHLRQTPKPPHSLYVRRTHVSRVSADRSDRYQAKQIEAKQIEILMGLSATSSTKATLY